MREVVARRRLGAMQTMSASVASGRASSSSSSSSSSSPLGRTRARSNENENDARGGCLRGPRPTRRGSRRASCRERRCRRARTNHFGCSDTAPSSGASVSNTTTSSRLIAAKFAAPVFQGSTDHRGTPGFPGRTATLERCDASEVLGRRVQVPAERRAGSWSIWKFASLITDEAVEMDLYAADDAGATPVIENAVTYIATPADINLNWLGDADDVANNRAARREANSDYLYNLCEALRALDIEDDDLYALEASVRAIRGDWECIELLSTRER